MFMPIPNPSAIYGSIIPLLVLDVIAVALRFYARRKRRQPFQTDDWLTIPGLILIFGLASIIFYGLSTHTLGYPAPEMEITSSNWTIVTARTLDYAFLVISAVANGLVRCSVLFFYRRIFVVEKRLTNPRNLFFVVFIVLVALWSVGYTFTIMFMCKGRFRILFTDLIAVMDYCINILLVGYSYAISGFVIDALMILVPLPFIWQLHLPFASKLAVSGVFLLGILAAGASLIRMLWQIWASNVGFDPTMDEELLLTEEVYWCMMEVSIGLLAACLPTLRGLFKSKSVDSLMNNIRSLFSLGSGSSSRLASRDNTRPKESDSMERDIVTESSVQVSVKPKFAAHRDWV